MTTAVYIRGIGGLIISVFGGISLLVALCVGAFISMNERVQSFAVSLPGGNATQNTDTTGVGLQAVFALLLTLGAGSVFTGLYQLRLAFAKLDQTETTQIVSVEDRFDELERLKRREMVTAEEYAIKRQEILKNL